ncbi:ATP-dependent DNA ligase [Nocardia camponoti]|uniref:DNA ligase (ATP) n=1 Tax=Nocardia camponoti TaxID=1616106 RepID=A0A917VB26_9NOCA|nr:ATP-dependent DNA ligase [Nocardia camponoti]GGK58302.1 multifunctional non-homologous end joining protein LigD [Nocardia camponoti]
MVAEEFAGAPGQPDIEVELSNLDKVLYPETGTTKGAVIAYYAAIAPAMLPHIAGRPATRKRWPNGVDHPDFFEKNLPASAPQWIHRVAVQHSNREVVYPVFDSQAGLAWLGQQAALEIHVPQWRFVDDERGPATRIVFDLDPGPGAGLVECARVALAVRDMVAEIGLRAYPVTSGSKGIHVYVPLEREVDSAGASTVAKQVAKNLQQLHPELVTATMAKTARVDKVFLDWSQNNAAKTTIAPYSMRGRPHPMAAAPRTWAEIEDAKALRQLTFEQVLARFAQDGDLLAGLDPPLRPDPLTKYRSMRDPARTPEPVPATPPRTGSDDQFVVQEHHARRLHFDVRLEHDGTLASWAVPKGPPTDPKHNRLAVRTEDHPLEYLDFHGTIPKGEYGAGAMTIWDRGTYTPEKWRDDEVIVDFDGDKLHGRYAFIRTKGDQWLMHKMRDQPAEQKPVETAFPRGLRPMLASPGDVEGLPSEGWSFETKWDGFRVIVELDDGELTIRSRNGNVVTTRYPRFAAIVDELAGHNAVLDGEAVVLNADGLSDIAALQADAPRAVFVAFDLLYLDGTLLLDKRYSDRRVVLEMLGRLAPSLHVEPQSPGPGKLAMRLSRDQRQEGVVAKRLDSRYTPGKRSPNWIKERNWRTREVVVGGWRASEKRPFKSLLLGVREGDQLIYVGRVGTGFGYEQQDRIGAALRELARPTSPFTSPMTADEKRDAHWVEPELEGIVRFQAWTDSGRLWHPVWDGVTKWPK